MRIIDEVKWLKILMPNLKNKQIENYLRFCKANKELEKTKKDFEIVSNEFTKLNTDEIERKSKKHLQEIKQLNEELEKELKRLEGNEK